MRFCSNFPALLARQPPGCLPTLCKSSLANQNSCRQPPDPEFPDKEMFMLSIFFPCSFFLFFFLEWSPLTREWGQGGKKKPERHALDLKCWAQACMGRSAGLFVDDSIVCVCVCVCMGGGSMQVWVDFDGGGIMLTSGISRRLVMDHLLVAA